MSYDNPFRREVYVFANTTFGSATESQKIIGPKGKKGLVREIFTHVTADMVGTTTVPEIDVGATSGSFEYARHRLGTTAILGNTLAGSPYRASALAAGSGGSFTGGVPPTLNDYAGHVALETARIPADTAFFITRTAGVGGTPAGFGVTEVTIDWD